MSCGCKMVFKAGRKRREAQRNGTTSREEYKIWAGIGQRCRKKLKSQSWSRYYSGVKMSEDWMNSFSNFFRDVGKRPGKGFSIERKDNRLGYCKHNCRWATKYEQILNRRISTKNGVSCGVRKNKSGTFSARISILGRMFHIGTFSQKKAAEKEFRRYKKFIDSRRGW